MSECFNFSPDVDYYAHAGNSNNFPFGMASHF